MTPLLAVQNVCRRFELADGSMIEALANVSLDVYENDFVCVLGSNGSGKTTLLRLVSKDIAPSSGHVRFRNRDLSEIRTDAWRLYLSEIHQNPLDGLALQLTVEEHFLVALLKGRRLSLRSYGYGRDRRRRIRDVVGTLPGHADRMLNQRICELSGGERQLVALVMLYMQTPGLVILDEPTAALDPRNTAHIVALLQAWASEKISTLLMVTHHIETALSLRCPIVVLHRGQVAGRLTASEAAAQSSDGFRQRYFV